MKSINRPLAHHGIAANLEDKKYTSSLLGIEIYSHVKKKPYCSVLQIGCIPTEVCKGSIHRVEVCKCFHVIVISATNNMGDSV